MASADDLRQLISQVSQDPRYFPEPGPNQLYARRPGFAPGSELAMQTPFVNRDLLPGNRASLYSNFLPYENTRNILTRLGTKNFNPLESESAFRGPLRGTVDALQRMSSRNSINAPLGIGAGRSRELARSNMSGLGGTAERMGLQYDEKRQAQFLQELLKSYLLGGKIYGAQADASAREQELKTSKNRGYRNVLGQIPIAGGIVGGIVNA